MLNVKGITKEFLIYGLGNSIGRFSAILLVPLFTRSLSEAYYGALDLSFTTLIIISLLLGLQTESGMIRHYYEAQENGEVRELVSTAFWTWTTTAFVGCLLLVILAPVLSPYVYHDLWSEGIEWIRLLALSVFFHLEFRQLIHVFKLQHRAILFSTLNITPFLFFALISLMALYLEWKVSGILLSFALGNVISFLLTLFFARSLIGLVFDRKYLKKILCYGLPVVPSTVLHWGQRHGIRIVIAGFLGMAQMGIYGVADKMAMIVGMLDRAFGDSWAPHSTKIMNKEGSLEAYARFFNLYMVLTLLGVLLLLLINPLIIRILAPVQYWQAEKISGWLICGMAIFSMSDFTSLGNRIAKKTYRNLPGSICSVITSIGGTALILPLSPSLSRIGEMFFAGALIGNLVLLWTAQRIVQIPFKRRSFVIGLSVLAVLGWVSSVSYWGLYFCIPITVISAYFIMDKEDLEHLRRRIPLLHKEIYK